MCRTFTEDHSRRPSRPRFPALGPLRDARQGRQTPCARILIRLEQASSRAFSLSPIWAHRPHARAVPSAFEGDGERVRRRHEVGPLKCPKSFGPRSKSSACSSSKEDVHRCPLLVLLTRQVHTSKGLTYMKVVGYARVSTRGQAEDGLGLPVQVEGIQKWAQAHGHELVAVVTDEGISGTRDAWDRPGLTEALGLIESGSVDGFVVHRLDRLARSLTVQEAILAHLWKHDARVFTVDQGPVLQDDPDDPMRTAMRQMAGVFAQLERAMLVKRLRDARKHKAARGGHAVGGPPFGYRPGDWNLEEDPTEQETLALIRRLHAEGSNPSDIARRLNDAGLRSKRGGRWHPTSVRRIVGRMVSATEKEDVKLAG